MSVVADHRALARRLASREREPEALLPYARHVDDQVIALDDGGLMACFALDGAAFETADLGELNDRHARLNGVWRNLADERLALWHHLVRREQDAWPKGSFRSDFARELDQAYREAMSKGRLFVNELYLTLLLRSRPHHAGAWLARLQPHSSAGPSAEDLSTLRDASRDIIQHLARFNPRPLSLYEHRGLWFSEPLEMLRLVMTGKPGRAPLVRGHLGHSIYRDRLIFGRETMEIREAGETRFAAILGVKEYPAATRPGLWDDLLSAPLPLTVAQSFAFISKTSARSLLERKQNQMISARDRAASQIQGLGEALDDLTSNRFVMGDHQASVLVHAPSPAGVAEAASKVRAVLADSGLVAVREDLGLEGGLLSMGRPAAAQVLVHDPGAIAQLISQAQTAISQLEQLREQVFTRITLRQRLAVLAAFAAAWSYFITIFGWAIALVGWWPSAAIGGGGALAVLQASQLCGLVRNRRGDLRRPLQWSPNRGSSTLRRDNT
jgi:type IV secretion system protein VirB4